MRRIIKSVLIFVVLMAGVAGAVACASTPAPPPDSPEIAAIRAYADPATQATLAGLSEDNLAKYTQYANAQFKAVVTQDILDKTYAQINSQLGGFLSITFLRTEPQGDYTVVHYKAKYVKGDAGVRMVFDKDHLLAGQWFE